jgi:pyridoxal phosphate enzyme (YggS family)
MSIAQNLRDIQIRMEAACDSVRRDPSEVILVAVSKTVQFEFIREAYDAGHRHFGESRLQEAQPKIEALPKDIVWHFVGHLQSNKAKKAARIFNVLHTIDSESQLKQIDQPEEPRSCFIEVNIADEPQKSGISPRKVDEFAKTVLNYPQVRLDGLMTVGPLIDDPEGSRMYFRNLRNLGEKIGVHQFSMGMSQDFDVAIQEGATHVRVGSAIFGSRT